MHYADLIRALREHGPMSNRQLAEVLAQPLDRVRTAASELSKKGEIIAGYRVPHACAQRVSEEIVWALVRENLTGAQLARERTLLTGRLKALIEDATLDELRQLLADAEARLKKE